MIDSKLIDSIRETCESTLDEMNRCVVKNWFVEQEEQQLRAIIDLCGLYSAQLLTQPVTMKPMFHKYMFGFLMGSAVIDNAISLRDAVIQLADTLEMHTDLFDTAISACDDTNCVQMFNQFAPSSSHIIKVVWKLDECVYEEPKHDDDDT